MDPARELPYRPAAAQRRIRGRTDGSIRLRAKAIPKFPLARKGASTDGKQAIVSDRISTGILHAMRSGDAPLLAVWYLLTAA